jgi:myotubularin-related protein 3/4
MDAQSNFFSRVGLAISMYASSKPGNVEEGGGVSTAREEELSFSPIRNSELYPHKSKVVDKGCSPTVQPFPSLNGEAIEFIGLLGTNNHIAISNYRFFASRDDGFYNVPVGLIDAVETYGSKEQIVVLCKDGGRFSVTFDSQASCHTWLERLRKVIRGAKDLDKTFAFVHWAYGKDQQAMVELETRNSSMFTPLQDQRSLTAGHLPILEARPYGSDVVRAEFYRMNMDTDKAWRITDCNSEYKLCATYPKLFVVSSAVSEEEIRSAAKFRATGRVPAVVWRHAINGAVIARSSQPLVGVLSWRNSEDEKLLLAISQSCALTSVQRRTSLQGSSNPIPIPYRNGGPPAQTMEDRGQITQSVLVGNGHSGGLLNGHVSTSQPSCAQDTSQLVQDTTLSRPELQDRPVACPELLVMDLRSYAAVLGNRAKGGGCECTDYYPNCEIVYKNVPNIHSVRKSFQQLRNLLLCDDQSNFLSNLESTQWLHYLCQLVSVACDVVKNVNDRGKPVLVHCSDGWDRTAQVVSLAELMLDPYYRTIEGFQVLIEREWLGFGHRFSDRCGQHAACSDSNQRCPVFLQWLDCVHQLVIQFPCHFQFNINFLVKLGLHSYSCLYGTLMGNCMRERDSVKINERTVSLWSYLNTHNTECVNHLFSSSGPRVLRPVAHIHKMQLWQAMFTAPSLTPSSALSSPAAPSLTHTTTLSSTAATTSSSVTAKMRCLEAESASPEVPAEVEMKEMSSYRNNRTSSDRPQSDSSFASVSSSSPASLPPLAGGDGGSKVKPCGVEGEQQLEVKTEGGGDEKLNSSDERSLEEMSPFAPEPHTSPPSTASDDTAIATGSTHSSHVVSPTSFASLPDLLCASPNARHLNAISADLLHDAMHDHSPQPRKSISLGHRHQTNRVEGEQGECTEACWDGESCSSVRLDADGIPSRWSEEDRRLAYILQSYEARIIGLRQELIKVKAELTARVKEGMVAPGGRQDGGKEGKEEEEEAVTVGASIAVDNQSPSSLASWDCVEGGEGLGVRWVPDHAATHCQDCGEAFSLIVRKHHCRACGGVFCYTCTDYMCPVPDEQLYSNVKVCSRCYYRLDGHLTARDSGPT